MAGYTMSRADLDNSMWQCIVRLRDTFSEIERIQAYIGRESETLMLEFGYSEADMQLMAAAFNDLKTLSEVANGRAAQPATNDFFAWARQLTGVK